MTKMNQASTLLCANLFRSKKKRTIQREKCRDTSRKNVWINMYFFINDSFLAHSSTICIFLH